MLLIQLHFSLTPRKKFGDAKRVIQQWGLNTVVSKATHISIVEAMNNL